jgi:hypothetical protein
MRRAAGQLGDLGPDRGEPSAPQAKAATGGRGLEVGAEGRVDADVGVASPELAVLDGAGQSVAHQVQSGWEIVVVDVDDVDAESLAEGSEVDRRPLGVIGDCRSRQDLQARGGDRLPDEVPRKGAGQNHVVPEGTGLSADRQRAQDVAHAAGPAAVAPDQDAH